MLTSPEEKIMITTITFDPAGHVEGFGWISETWGMNGFECSRDDVEQAIEPFGMTIETLQGQMYQDPSGRHLIDLEL